MEEVDVELGEVVELEETEVDVLVVDVGVDVVLVVLVDSAT